ncbi:hypothetical protein MTR67_039680 [Solanum verrucosum]|uniref:Gag-pol polyprotein n=1 Tax=Solanum verrucosum TaxID=315347 RepID=A0AAF0ZQY3_SOLVR|nr:hypothetical protein MTR67_039680 [Solanum verrucosum]
MLNNRNKGYLMHQKCNQGEVINAEFYEAIWMLSQIVTNQAGKQRENHREVAHTSRIREFLKMNPLSFTGSSVIEDPKNFVEELQKVFVIMHIADAERVELVAYQLKSDLVTPQKLVG